MLVANGLERENNMKTQKIIPHLWFDKEAKEAAEIYGSLFPNSKVTNVTKLHDTSSGDVDIVSLSFQGSPSWPSARGPSLNSIHRFHSS